MSTVPVFVGLDYSLTGVQVCVLDREGKMLGNQKVPDRVEAIVGAASRIGPVHSAAIEACCGASDLAEEIVQQHGWLIHLGHPGYVSRIKQNPDKTDFSDAHLLADLERVGYLPRVWLAPKSLRELRTLVRDRQALVRHCQSIRLRLTALLRDHRQVSPCNRWTQKWYAWLKHGVELGEHSRWVLDRQLDRLAWMTREIRQAEKRLHETMKDDRLVQFLVTIKGVGYVTAWTLRTEIGRFDRFRTGRQLARFCGLSPCNRSSGLKVADAGLIRAANPELRRVLIETAWSLIRHQPRWRKLAASLRERGKSGSVTCAAVANRFVRWLWHQVMKNIENPPAVDNGPHVADVPVHVG